MGNVMFCNRAVRVYFKTVGTYVYRPHRTNKVEANRSLHAKLNGLKLLLTFKRTCLKCDPDFV